MFCFFPGNNNICPECGSDHVVQLAGQSAPYCSTPIKRSLRPDSEDEQLDIIQNMQSATKVFRNSKPLAFCFPSFLQIIFKIVQPESHHFGVLWFSQQDDYTDASISSSPVLEAATTTEDPIFITAQGSSFFTGDGQGDTSSLSYTTDCQSKDDLAGSYRYTSIAATPPEVPAQRAGRSTPNGEFSLC